MINKLKRLSVTSFLLFIIGCSTMVHKQNIQLPLSKKYAIASFWNYTETPMAGLRASTIMESVLSNKGIVLNSLIGGSEEMANIQSKKAFLEAKKEEARKLGSDYLITGNVQEWRYKTGIDGEPVVSFSLNIIDLHNNRVVSSAVGAKSAWGHKSIGVVAQEIALSLTPIFVN
jgi:curli biogenesis system outer membrane secretion channel CsgG